VQVSEVQGRWVDNEWTSEYEWDRVHSMRYGGCGVQGCTEYGRVQRRWIGTGGYVRSIQTGQYSTEVHRFIYSDSQNCSDVLHF
jgi:hypothetical protein